ncbi:MAG: hypothetical protein ACFFB6_05550 [Promethearchaeota archaeon]
MKRVHRIVLIVVAACIVTGGTAFGVLIFGTWGTLDYENNYYYNPSIPSPIERININCDIGTVIIKYNNTPTNFYAQVDLGIHIEGILVKGSSLLDFFHPIVWENTSSVTTFTLAAKATTWFIFGFLQQIEVNLTLRTDVIYDINSQTSTGAIYMAVPSNTIVNNTLLSTATGVVSLEADDNTIFQGNVGLTTSTGGVALYARQVNFTHDLIISTATGEIYLNFSRCIIGRKLIGTVSTGSITFNSYNMKYTGDYLWYLHTSTGSIYATILQYNEMGANITGSMQTSTGSINVYYRDNLASVGAKFICSTSTGSNSFIPIGTGGFTDTGSNPKTITSDDYDYTATNRYTFSAATSTGSIQVLGESK